MILPVNYNTLSNQDRKLVREEYIRQQDGKCAHCGGSLSSRPPLAIAKAFLDGPFDQDSGLYE